MKPAESAIVTIFALLSAAAYSRSVSVSIDTGRLSGVREGSIVAYKGIPFAEPPVGNLRWQPPQRAKKWTGTLDANTFKPQCMQLGPPLPTMPVEPNSEDCLYLNLWAPVSQDESKRAVMVFLYGGGFRRGSASTPLYWGDRLARSKGVIVVNLAYRLGPLGFLAHLGLTEAKIPLLVSYTDDGAVNLIQPVSAEKYAANVRAQYGDVADEFLRLKKLLIGGQHPRPTTAASSHPTLFRLRQLE
jgi:hypothetical protein